ncbi:MAG TPA: EcsC family protein [Flavisolibacter sp.]|nr:EcsC family protein [Flavisolibacter sp.]
MKIDQAILTAALEWSYDRALNGVGPFGSAYSLAEEYLNKTGSRDAAVGSIIDWQIAKCATSGFVTGLGGLMTLPVAIPANISSVLLLQLRMITSIAIIGGFDPRSRQVKSLAFLCLTGRAAPAIMKEAGVDVGHHVTENIVQRISDQVMRRINYLVKIRLFTKTGKIGLMKFGKAIPLLGGVIGGTIDAASTRLIGQAARQVFIPVRNA